ncbi:hypothetical protein VIPPAEUMC01_00040 [Pseudomonas phage vB_VIPPAEUMC01]|uniref:DUF4326 domain-containing protein n=3 Tax=Viruses TaxID=10239 RepID=A0AAF0FYX7_9CAUD|nr:hypothetical protein VIPPAEUMC01_00040 [Pseudomonas phage vB_VIPPAEUMC01]
MASLGTSLPPLPIYLHKGGTMYSATVVNRHYEKFDVYIGRGSKWGNPFSHKEGTRALYKVDTVEQAIECFRSHLWRNIMEGLITVDDLLELDGKRLGCYCKPRPCHGDVLVRAIEWAKQHRGVYK